MKRVISLAIFAFLGLCLISSPIQAAVPTAGSAPVQPAFSLVDNIRDFFCDPNIAYLLLTIAFLGLLIEIITPGIYLSGFVGIVAAVLAFYALGLLSVNPLGLIAIALALPLFVFGAYRAKFFIPFTVAGIAALIVGSLFLFHSEPGIHPALIAVVVLIMSVAFILTSNRVVKSQRRRVATGTEDLLSRTAIVRTPLTPEGTVMVEGELWQAEIDQGEALNSEEVIVTAIQGLKLTVTKKKGGS